MKPTIVLIGGIFILLGILAGAFGAHILENHLSIQQLTSLQTGVQYQIYHGLALIIIGFNFDKIKNAKIIYWGWVVGILLFSGSIYFLALDDIFESNFGILWPLTPIGGSLLIVTWALFVIQFIKLKN
ncbi:MAG: DUF423 domain-containing protein [Bacteroidota bacterium]|nr:DUF423 domain-containing protein [Bacteroidota bacterium]